MNNELTPCPFCGSSHVELVCSGSAWFVRCNECDSTGPGVTDGDDNDTAKAAAAWATRHAGDERRHVVCLCPDCAAMKPHNARIQGQAESGEAACSASPGMKS